VRTLETFQGTHVLGASRGLLCDSSAVLLDTEINALAIACIICCRVNVTLDMILGIEDILISWFVIIFTARQHSLLCRALY